MSRKRKRPGSKAGKREEKERREESANGLRGPPLCIIKSRDDVAECEVPCRRCVEKAGGGVRDPAGMRALRKMHSLLSLPSLRPVTRPPLAQVLQPNPSRNSGNKPETPTRFFDWWPPRNFNRGTFQGGRIDWEKFFIRRGLGIFGVFEDFIFSWGRRGVTSRVTKNDVSCKIRGEFFF